MACISLHVIVDDFCVSGGRVVTSYSYLCQMLFWSKLLSNYHVICRQDNQGEGNGKQENLAVLAAVHTGPPLVLTFELGDNIQLWMGW